MSNTDPFGPLPDRPIFIVGLGRCGSTILHHMFSEHPHVAWLSGFGDRMPTSMKMHRRMLGWVDLPLVGGRIKATTEPGECYDTWEHHVRGFRRSFRDLRTDDVSVRSARRARAMTQELLVGRRQRALYKITGWPRLGFLYRMFPNALFIHCLRDGRGNVNSLLNVDFWLGWRGTAQWRFGELPDAYQREWEQHDRSFVALAGIQWKLFLDALEVGKESVPAEQFVQVRYEDLCEDRHAVFSQLCEFTDLPMTDGFKRRLDKFSLRNANTKYQQDLTPEQQEILQSVMGEYLERYGY